MKLLMLLLTFTFIVGSLTAVCNRSDFNQLSVLSFGAKGDGVHDDSFAFEKGIEFCVNNRKTLYVPKTSKAYNITKTIRVQINGDKFIRIKSNGAIIKPKGKLHNNSAYNLTSFREHIFMSIGRKFKSIHEDDLNVGTNINSIMIDGLVFDGSLQNNTTNVRSFANDIYICLQLVAGTVSVTNCKFLNISGYGIRMHEISNASVKNSFFDNVGGRGLTVFADSIDLDGYGDGIYIAKVNQNARVLIDSCIINGSILNGKRSRSGITFEYSKNPYTIDIKNTVIQGYAKGIHIEEIAKTTVNITNVVLKDFNFGIANVLNDRSKIFINNSLINVGMIDKKDNGDALAFLNYQSKAQIYVDNSCMNFKGRTNAYQSAVGLKQVQNTTINAFGTNFFFADGSTVFNNCKFIDFGGSNKSFSSNSASNSYKINNSIFNNTKQVEIKSENVKLSIIKSRKIIYGNSTNN